MKIVPVILSGGIGTRLWPLSRKDFPKQYIPLVSELTMLQETILRLKPLQKIDEYIIICNSEHRFTVAEQCQQINIGQRKIILEPISKNTAPAISAAALQCLKSMNDVLLLVLSADHVILNTEAFRESIEIAKNQAMDGKLTTFGVVPTNANTGYGYIKLSTNKIRGAYKVEKFVEKPDIDTAKKYVSQGNYLWNSGMFMFKATTLINELKKYSPQIVKNVDEAVENSTKDLDFIRLNLKSFEKSPSDSIDYALMEKSEHVAVVPLNAGWNDVGSWKSLHEIGVKDKDNNVLHGDIIAKDTTNSYIYAKQHLITTIGVDNLIIVDTPDATLIANKNKAHEVKSVTKELKKNNRLEADHNRKVFRPWGWYDSLETGANFQVKRLHVNPGAKLSIQMHYKRAEHWVVVAGKATVLNGNDIITLKKGESTYIPLKTKHSLENKTDDILEIIEVQSGVYLGEDDIVRYEDIYGRV